LDEFKVIMVDDFDVLNFEDLGVFIFGGLESLISMT